MTAEDLRALAEFLSPHLALEVHRLQAVEEEHELLAAEVLRLNRQLNTAQVMVGELRQRAVRAETRLGDLGAEEIRKAQAAAFMVGEGFVRVTSHGRGRFTTEHVPTDQVVVRAARSAP